MITSYFDMFQRGLYAPHLYESKKFTLLKRLVLVLLGGCLGVMIVLLATISVYGEPDSNVMFPSVIAALIMLLLGESAASTIGYKAVICKALAGLEEGHWHCAEDLHLWLNIPLPIGKRIIAGDYDDLLRDELTCKFIGK